MSEVSRESDLALLEHAAREAGAVISGFRGGRYQVWSKGEAGPVTEADHAANETFARILLGARPDYGWLSEETPPDQARLDRRRAFIVDPLDGTQRFMDGDPHFCAAVALTEDGAAVAGAIFMPATGTLFSGAIGIGARVDGAPVTVSSSAHTVGLRLLGRPRDFAGFGAPEWSVRRVGPLGVCGAFVARGDYDGLAATGAKHEWDVAPAAAIVAAAGGRASDQFGQALRFNTPLAATPGAVMARPAVHELLIRRLRDTQRGEAPRELKGDG